MRVEFFLYLKTIPIVGDFIHVDPKYITEISTKLIDRDSVKKYGLTFCVVKRTKYMTSHLNEDWRIELSPFVPLKNIK